MNFPVYDIAIDGGNVYVGGVFTDAGGNTSADYTARWDGTNWNALGSGVNSFVGAIAIDGGNVYAGGSFTDAGDNTSADRIARWEEPPLPVALLDFGAAVSASGAVVLTWHTASESNNKGFDIEWSGDGRTWQTLGFVPGQGTTEEPRQYTYRDERSLVGHNYYRLRQVDYDGQYEYSEVRSVVLENSAGLQVYPNPVQAGLLYLSLPTEPAEDAALRLFDTAGRLHYQERLSSRYHQSDARRLPMGIYIVEVRSGQNVWRQRVVVE